MFLRISSTLLLSTLLLACESEVSGEPEGPSVDCAIGPGAELTATCTFEWIADSAFIIHRPDGGFRRFSVLDSDEGVGITTADGADLIVYHSQDETRGVIEFGLTDEAYRLDVELVEVSKRSAISDAGPDE